MSEQLDKDLMRMLSLLGNSTNLIERAKPDKWQINLYAMELMRSEKLMYSQEQACRECKALADEIEYHMEMVHRQHCAASRAVAAFHGELHPEDVAPPRKKERGEDLPMAGKGENEYVWKR